MNNVKKLTKDDLKVGMFVTQEQISEIYDLYIYLESTHPTEMTGTIIYLTDSPIKKETDRILKDLGYLCCFYQSSEDLEGEFL